MLKRTGLVLMILVAALALGAAGCGGDDEESGAAEATTSEGGGEAVTVELAEQNGSGQTGTATLTPAGAGITVKIELGSAPGDPQPAHIHSGTCAQLGDVVFPLTNLEGGSSETEVATSLDDLHAGDFAVNVHESEANIGNYVACGDIPKS